MAGRSGRNRRGGSTSTWVTILIALVVFLTAPFFSNSRSSTTAPSAEQSQSSSAGAPRHLPKRQKGPSSQDGSSGSGETESGTPKSRTAQPDGPVQSDGNGARQDGTVGSDQTLATAVLNQLPVKGRAPKTGYARTQFGPAWADVDHNGCDTRNDILNRDLKDVTHRPGTHDCIVLTGVLNDPYTGRTIHFQRGRDTSTAVQIDHVVALSDAWQTGAQQLSADRRRELANDPDNLLAVDGPANQQKSDSDAASWLPANRSFRCAYVARQIGVKRKYSLWVTAAEKGAMQRVLSSCPAQKVPVQ